MFSGNVIVVKPLRLVNCKGLFSTIQIQILYKYWTNKIVNFFQDFQTF